MIADLVELGSSGARGVGLFARTRIPRGTVIGHRCANCTEVCSRQELEAMTFEQRERVLQHTYGTDEGGVVLDCSIGRYINHDCAANVLEAPGGFDIAVDDIRAAEEITCDYRQLADPAENGFACHCATNACCGHVACVRPVPDALQREWDRRIEPALRRLKLPHRFLTGVGSRTRVVATWTLAADGRWMPPLVLPAAPVRGAIGALLARAADVPIVGAELAEVPVPATVPLGPWPPVHAAVGSRLRRAV